VLLGILVFTRFRFAPGAWLAFVALVLVHELGHAAMVFRYGLRVTGLEVHGLGGECRWSGEATAWQRAAIAWGGVLAQLVLLVGTCAYLWLMGGVATRFWSDFVEVFVYTNVGMALFNLVPIPPLDGAKAWAIVPLLKSRSARRESRASKRLAAKEELHRMEPIDYGRGGLSDADEARIRKLFEDAAAREKR
jgi:Zn-dependent protease